MIISGLPGNVIKWRLGITLTIPFQNTNEAGEDDFFLMTGGLIFIKYFQMLFFIVNT